MKVKRPYKWVEQAVVISAMRRVFRRYPGYKACLEAAKSEYFVPSKTGKPMRRVQFKCAKCLKQVKNTDKVVDHILPVVNPSVGYVDYNVYAQRLFCSIDNLQCICISCHKEKSRRENLERKKSRKR